MEPLIFVAIFMVIVILFRIFILSEWDRDRIKKDASQRGWQIITIDWEPFGPGWMGEKNDRIYGVLFIDETGRKTQRYCKTSMLSGVYWK